MTAARPPFAPTTLQVVAHSFLLVTLAVAQPLYDLLGRHAELFVARRTPPAQVWLLVAVLSFALPAAVAGLVLALRPLGERARARALLAVVALGGAIVVLPPLKRAGVAAAPTLVGAAVAGVGLAVLYRRFAAVRDAATLFALAVPIFPLVFVALTPVARVVFPAKQAAISSPELGWGEVPVVIVVFDMLSVVPLLDDRGEVDAQRYPAFGRLAATSTFFRQTRTVAAETSLAVPALLTGVGTVKGARLPVLEDYPRNLFSWLGPRARTRAFESMTWLCPPQVCVPSAEDLDEGRRPTAAELFGDVRVLFLHLTLPGALARDLPAVDGQWYGFGGPAVAEPPPALTEEERAKRQLDVRKLRKVVGSEDRAAKVARFLAALPTTPGRSLSYLHVNLPHAPLEYLPSGRRYVEPDDPAYTAFGPLGAVRGSGAPTWDPEKPIEVEISYRRYLLQVGYVDLVLARLLDRLQALGLLDAALLVVTADHGQAFVAGGGLRDLTDGDTLHVPLFVKLPGQRRGLVDDRPADLRDVLPTLAAVLGTEIPWPVEGRSLLDREALERATGETVADVDAGRRPAEAWTPTLLASWRRKLERVGSGDPLPIYTAGPRPDLVGRRLRQLVAKGVVTLGQSERPLRYSMIHEAELRRRRPDLAWRPAYLIGQLGRKAEPPPGLALVLDGRVWATAYPYTEGEDEWIRFLFLVPEKAIDRGRHRFKLMAMDRVDEGAGAIRLTEVGRRERP